MMVTTKTMMVMMTWPSKSDSNDVDVDDYDGDYYGYVVNGYDDDDTLTATTRPL